MCIPTISAFARDVSSAYCSRMTTITSMLRERRCSSVATPAEILLYYLEETCRETCQALPQPGPPRKRFPVNLNSDCTDSEGRLAPIKSAPPPSTAGGLLAVLMEPAFELTAADSPAARNNEGSSAPASPAPASLMPLPTTASSPSTRTFELLVPTGTLGVGFHQSS